MPAEFVTTVKRVEIPGLGTATFTSSDRPLSVVYMRDGLKLTWDEIALRIGRDERTARRRYRKEKLGLTTRRADPVRSAIERLARSGESQG